MNVTVTYYLDVVSSWCYWAEPAWAELKQRYTKAPVEFGWAIALLDESGMSKSRAQADWFYRRSGTIVRSPFMLNSGWLTHSEEHLPPHCVAEAAKDFGATDDRVRLALALLPSGQIKLRWPANQSCTVEITVPLAAPPIWTPLSLRHLPLGTHERFIGGSQSPASSRRRLHAGNFPLWPSKNVVSRVTPLNPLKS